MAEPAAETEDFPTVRERIDFVNANPQYSYLHKVWPDREEFYKLETVAGKTSRTEIEPVEWERWKSAAKRVTINSAFGDGGTVFRHG